MSLNICRHLMHDENGQYTGTLQYVTVEEAKALRKALVRAEALFTQALPKFNWGASALDADAIALLNEVPGEVRKALKGSQ